jgi:hypothetical protein
MQEIQTNGLLKSSKSVQDNSKIFNVRANRGDRNTEGMDKAAKKALKKKLQR